VLRKLRQEDHNVRPACAIKRDPTFKHKQTNKKIKFIPLRYSNQNKICSPTWTLSFGLYLGPFQ
jgi:hypothetical protein